MRRWVMGVMGDVDVGYTRVVHEVQYSDGSVHTQMSQVNRWDLSVHEAIEMMVGALVAGGYSEELVRRAMREVEQVDMVDPDGEKG